MTPYQLILSLIALVFIYSNGKNLLKTRNVKFLLPTLIFAGILALSLFPSLAHLMSSTLGLGENLNTLIFTGFVIVYIMMFKVFRSVEEIKRDITQIVQKQALKDFENSDHEHKHHPH